MGSGRRIGETQLWQLALLGLFFWCCLTDATPLNIMSCPNVLRVGAEENIFIECQGCSDAQPDMRVIIKVLSSPTKSTILTDTSVTLTKDNNFQQFGQITIPSDTFYKIPSMTQHVYLQAHFPGVILEKVVLVSFQSGYIFIQTDKTLYTPNSIVHFRIFAVTPNMEPVERDTPTSTYASVAIEMMTPEGISLSLPGPVILDSGMYSGIYPLSEIVSLGLWKVVAKFPLNPQYSYSAEFEVKEYVLPSFEVKLTPMSSFFHVNSPKLTIKIKATYLFGKDVEGSASAVFGLMHEGQKAAFQSSIQRVSIEEGEGEVTLRKEHIIQANNNNNNIDNLVGKSIYVAVNVLTENGGEMVQAEWRNIKIVKSPYTIHFKKTPKYFKPGMNLDVVIEALNPDDTPAKGIALVMNPGNVIGSTEDNGMARLSINTNPTLKELIITASTDVPGVTQATATMTAYPYNTNSNSYIHIGVGKAVVKLGENLKVNFNYNKRENAQNDITYLIMSRGQLVKYERYRTKSEVVISKIVHITKDMLPSFRIIVYYHTNDNELVSDSVWVDVEDSCMGSLKLETKDSSRLNYEPGGRIQLKVTGDSGATVGLVAVDKGVFVLNNKHRLTQKKVWDLVEKHDTGCTPGGGKNGTDVFNDAGLVFHSNVGSGTPNRKELKCPSPRRRKRTSTTLDSSTSLLSQFADKNQRECCLDGFKKTPLSYNCERRSEYIMDGAACVEAFLRCCKEMEIQEAEKMDDILTLARSEEEYSNYDTSEIVTRSKFHESWHWTTIKLPPCSEPNCDTTEKLTSIFPLKDTITTWQFIGISLSKNHSICVADPLSIIAQKDFFIKLNLPYSVVRGEQLEFKAIIHNYIDGGSTVRVDLFENEHVCSAASRRGIFYQEVNVRAHGTRAVPFVIIPMKAGSLTIKVRASVKGQRIGDEVQKTLLVLPKGKLTKSLKIVTLDPARKGVGGRHMVTIRNDINMQEVVPGTEPTTEIYVSGREQLGTLLEETIGNKSMGSMIQKPKGCGEQNMALMTLPVIATRYLDKTNQWITAGDDRRDEALNFITTGYTNQLNYRKTDGSFAVFQRRPGSTWLTAYVAKVFSMASTLVAVDKKVVCDALNFVIGHQLNTGQFQDVGVIFDTAMIGDVRGKNSDVSMTAFCLIAIQESRTLCSRTIPHLQGSIDKAVGYLEGHLHQITNPYAAAISSYALAVENKLNRQILMKFISPELNHWPVYSKLLTLEATAYALLALIKVKALEEARPIVRWFTKQQSFSGDYGSTQATVMVYQAMAEYWTVANEEDYSMNIDLRLPGRTGVLKVFLDNKNHFYTKRDEFKAKNQDVNVTAEGTGEATVKMVSVYYALLKENESNCNKFNLSVKLIQEESENIYTLKIKVMYLDVQTDSTMAIVNIGMLTGFTADINDLKILSKGPARVIEKYEVINNRTDGASIIIYLEKISNKQEEEISFKLHQEVTGYLLQPAAVTVYEYYDHQNRNETHCVRFYHPKRKSGELLRLCRNNECSCSEEECTKQKKGKISNDDRYIQSCLSTEESKTDYVYKVRVVKFTTELSTDIFKMEILKVIKEGTDIGAVGKFREFISYEHCREALNLLIGKTYLIMGMDRDVRLFKNTQSHQYVLGERTWIEYWPTVEECQNKKYQSTCTGMEDLEQKYSFIACIAK
ncbi:complement C3-like [Seriola lalandi dorsalis]|uniref:complement C3-like n=2 Tax=Seriola lalandi dorsalis TaxID=1841481 RepID=UPI000C6F9C3E|nr:complement C3-like [Seriola lalandi dorsalis]